MLAMKNRPEPLVREGKIAHGTPLHRMASMAPDDEDGLYVGDIRDVLNVCPSGDEVVAKLVKKIGDKHKGEKVQVSHAEVEHVVGLLVTPQRSAPVEAEEATIRTEDTTPQMQKAKK
jgi:hypothetical protein